jgi:hypothetical protein
VLGTAAIGGLFHQFGCSLLDFAPKKNPMAAESAMARIL